MIKRLLRNLRQKPKPVRDRIALGVAVSFTAVVVAVWAYHFPTRVGQLTQETQEAEDAPGFSDIFKDFSKQMSSIKEAADEVSDVDAPVEQGPVNVASSSDFEAYGWPPKPVSDTVSSTVATVSSTTVETISPVMSVVDETATGSTPTVSPRPIRIVTTSSTSTATTSR